MYFAASDVLTAKNWKIYKKRGMYYSIPKTSVWYINAKCSQCPYIHIQPVWSLDLTCPPDNILMWALSSVCKICPSFSHVTRGSGTPPTSHFIVTAPPSVATWSSSPWDRAMKGGTVNHNVTLWCDNMIYWLSQKVTKYHYRKKKERMLTLVHFLLNFLYIHVSSHKILWDKTFEICLTS